MPSSSDPSTSRMRGSSALTAPGANAVVTSARSRVCPGGSRNSSVNSSGGGSMARCRDDRVPVRGSLPKRR